MAIKINTKILLPVLFVIFFLTAGKIFAASTPPSWSYEGNSYLNALHSNKTYSFVKATTKPNPYKTFASYGPQGLQKEVMGFAPYWDLTSNAYLNYPYKNLTTIDYFGITSDGNGNFGTNAGGGNGYTGLQSSAFVNMVNTAHNNNVRVVITAKIFNLTDIQSVVNSTTNTQNFINNIISITKKYNLQGVNIDFEYQPSQATPDTTTINNFTTLVSNLTTQMHQAIPGSFISVDVMASAVRWPGSLYNAPALANAADAINVMAYDYYTPSSSIAEPVSPFTGYNNGAGPLWYDVRRTILDYAAAINPNKIILGVPYYGNDYQTTNDNQNAPTVSGTGINEPYGQTNDKYKNQNTKHWDSQSSTPWYGYCYPSNNTPPNCASGDQLREGYYSNATSLGLVYSQVLNSNLRGVSIWTLGYEQPSTNLTSAINSYFTSSSLFSKNNSAYYILSSHGKILPLGNANYYGDMSYMNGAPNKNAVGLAVLPSDTGYYILTQDSGIYTFGTAKFHGSVYNIPNAPVKTPVAIATTPHGNGYYVLTADGGVYTFGTAQFHGSLYNIPSSAIPNRTPLAFAVTPNGGGYYIMTANGAVYTFGDAQFHGSVFNIPAAPNKNAVNFILTPSGNGYYITTQDGAVYTFGDAQFFGSMYNIKGAPNTRPVSLAVTANNQGYYLTTADGGIYTFGNAVYDGTAIGIFNKTIGATLAP
jgi:spore germination protein YaaH